jgi:hypothetical protein
MPVPKFNYNQRVYDRSLGFGWLVIKGLRFITEPVQSDYKVIYEAIDGGSSPQWEYNCYELKKNGTLLNHREIGWLKESDLSLNDDY